MKTKLYSQIRFVQSTDEDYNRIEAVFSGLRAGYCEGNSQPVIDYLSDWDDEENELIEEEPMIAKMGDTSYADTNGTYTLLYNSSIGGCFLLYREATEGEIEKPFYFWEAGTSRFEIWHWFDKLCPNGLAVDLMGETPKNS